jgi:hypothetical protein
MTDDAATGSGPITWAGIIIGVVCGIVIMVVLLLTLSPPRNAAAGAARRLKNSVMAKQIHQALMVHAHQNDGTFLVPGLVRRLPDPGAGKRVPGIGSEDVTLNTTAALHAALIMQNYYAPELLVSPLERNPAVSVDDDYDWEAYDPVNAVHWDDAFTADLATGSNVSYGHLPLAGSSRERWRSDLPKHVVQVGSRGPADGVASSSSLACAKDGPWVGVLVHADNSTEAIVADKGQAVVTSVAGDNPFAADETLGDRDAFIAFTRAVSAGGAAEIQHD